VPATPLEGWVVKASCVADELVEKLAESAGVYTGFEVARRT